MRIGFGYDSHVFDAWRPLMLGGVNIPGADGLKGHSDADVLIHAVIDALLGAGTTQQKPQAQKPQAQKPQQAQNAALGMDDVSALLNLLLSARK